MTNLADVFRVFQSIDFLEKYRTDEEKRKAIKELQSNSFSFYFHAIAYTFLACLIVVLIKLI